MNEKLSDDIDALWAAFSFTFFSIIVLISCWSFRTSPSDHEVISSLIQYKTLQYTSPDLKTNYLYDPEIDKFFIRYSSGEYQEVPVNEIDGKVVFVLSKEDIDNNKSNCVIGNVDYIYLSSEKKCFKLSKSGNDFYLRYARPEEIINKYILVRQ